MGDVGAMSARGTHREGGISARVLVRVVDFVAARGHDADALCQSVGLSKRVLQEPEARVPYALAERLGERAADLTGHTNFGLHLAQDVADPQRLDAGALLLMASPSIRIALERMARYQWHHASRGCHEAG